MEVNTRVLHDSGDELMHDALHIQHAEVHLSEIRHRLWDLSGMDGIMYALKKEERKLEQLSFALKKMGITLEEISARYERTERLVIDHFDNVSLNRPFRFSNGGYRNYEPIHFHIIHSLRYEKKYLRLINLLMK